MMHHLRKSTIAIWAVSLFRTAGKLATYSVATGSFAGSAAPPQIRSTRKLPSSGKFRLQLNSLGALLFLLLFADVSMASTTWFYAPQSVGNISGRAYADGDAPLHWLNMSTFGLTSSAVSQSITGWNVGSFSGITSPSPVGEYQLGIDNAAYGSDAVQMTNTAFGGIVNTFTIPGGSGYNNNLANMQVQYKWDAGDNLQPWEYSTSAFNFAYYLEVPGVYFTGGAVGYVIASVLVTDNNNHSIWLQTSAYDVRGISSSGMHEFIGFDTGTQVAYADSLYDSGTQYCTQLYGSSTSTGSTWSGYKWYGYSISRAQLLNAVNGVNSKYGVGLSTNPANYTLRFISIQAEIAWPEGNGWLGWGADQMNAWETY